LRGNTATTAAATLSGILTENQIPIHNLLIAFTHAAATAAEAASNRHRIMMGIKNILNINLFYMLAVCASKSYN
jgi:hypothetical protein